MRPGTPGFIGSNLKEAREARQLTITELAERLFISKQIISSYEKGDRTPGPKIMDNIAKVLKLPKHFFFKPSLDHGNGPIFYRSMSSTTKGARKGAERRFIWLKEAVRYLQDFVDMPKVNFPQIEAFPEPTQYSFDEIELIANECRQYWGLGDAPISNIVLLLENNGAIISRGKLFAKSLDAFSQWEDEKPYIFLGTDKQNGFRSRFDVSHELAHLIFHKLINRSLLDQKSDFNLIEEQANRFAGAFLLPAEEFSKNLYAPTLDAFRTLKERWRVSIAMMIMRCKHLKIIDEEYERYLWINYSRRGWRKEEPGDDKFAPESPRLLMRCVDLLIDNKIQTGHELLDKLPFSHSDLEEFLGLQEGYFEKKENEGGPKPSLREKNDANNLATTGKILKFPPSSRN